MEVYVHTLSPHHTAESRRHRHYSVPGTSDAEGVVPTKWSNGFSKEAVHEFLSQDLDWLVICCPGTEQTRGMIGKEQFRLLGKKNTFVTNVSRGTVVDTDALVEALNSETICGAAVDVTDPEPLTEGHPLWTAKNVTVSPHMSWNSKSLLLRIADLLYLNLERMERGEPLLNRMGEAKPPPTQQKSSSGNVDSSKI